MKPSKTPRGLAAAYDAGSRVGETEIAIVRKRTYGSTIDNEVNRGYLPHIRRWSAKGLAAVLIPPFAEIGAAVALLVTETVGAGIIFAVYLKTSKTHLKRAAWLRVQDVAVPVNQARTMLSAPHVE